MNDKDKAKEVDMIEYLTSLGYDEVSRGVGTYASFVSPFGNDTNASFMVKRSTNRFCDYTGGDHVSGDLIDLVCLLEHVAFKDAIDIILKRKVSENVPKVTFKSKQIKAGVEVLDVSDIVDHRLISYMEDERKIPIELANLYCDQLMVRFPNSKSDPEQTHVSIGFKNDKGGYEMRNKYLKIATSPKYYTIIRGSKSDELNVVEGFISFLSLLKHKGVERLEGDVLVMNSLSFYNEVIYLGQDYTTTNLYLDNGIAGNEKTMLMRSSIRGAKDCRGFYKNHEDLNDLITGKKIKM